MKARAVTILAADAETLSIERVREYEIEEARNLQQALVPTDPLRTATIEIAHLFHPVEEVGGDFLDYFLLSDGAAGIYLGDVVGKGLPAAFYAALAVGTFRGIHKTGQAPAHVLELFNKRLGTRSVSRRYCAAQYAVFDPSTRRLWFASAGLPGPVHLSSGACRELHAEGLPPGMFEDVRYEAQCLELAAGDAVLFFTDGITDARNPAGEDFGLEALLDVCAHNHDASPLALLQRIFAAVQEFGCGRRPSDDMTAAVLKFHPRDARDNLVPR